MKGHPISFYMNIDLIVFFLSLGITAYIGKKAKGSEKEQDQLLDYFYMGKSLSLPFFVATLVATWYGGILGVSAIAYEHGMFNFFTQGLFWYIAYLLFAFFMVDKIRGHDALNLASLVGSVYGKKAKNLVAILNFINVLPITYTMSLGIFLSWMFPILPYPISLVLGLGLVTLINHQGGLKSVIWTDAFQFLLMFLSVFLILFFSYRNYGNFATLQSHLPPHYFSLTSNFRPSTLGMWALVALCTLIDPNFYHRALIAKDAKTAKRGILICIVFWFIFDMCTTLGSMYARWIMPNLNPKWAYLEYGVNLLPTPYKGIFLSGIFAIIVSTLDSYLFVAAPILQEHLLSSSLSQSLSPKRSVLLCVLLCGILGIILQGNLLFVWKTLGQFTGSVLLIPLFLGRLPFIQWNENEFLFTCGVCTVFFFIKYFIPHSLEEIYFGILGSFLSTGLIFLYRRLIKKHS